MEGKGKLTDTNFVDVMLFHIKYDHSTPVGPNDNFDDQALMGFREKFLAEELDEFREGLEEHDMAKVADALVDLVYVAMGTAYLLGLPWQHLWNAVQRANMEKVRATSASQSKRDSASDVIKPEGWQPPNIAGILHTHGWDV